GDLSASAAVAQRATGLDRYSNAAVRALIVAEALAGRRAEALRTMELFTQRLAAELGTAPDAETLQLAARIPNERVWKRPPAEDGAAELSRRAPLEGRERQLGQLLRTWKECRSKRRSAIALIVGDPGTGRSRLAEELAERARVDGGAVVGIRAVEADGAEPGNGLLALAGGGLLELPGVAAAPAPALGALAARLPAWAERFPAVAPDPSREPTRAVGDVARAASEERPLILSIDDAHWLDRESLLAVRALARALGDRPCLLLLTAAAQPPRAEIDDLRSRIGRDVRGVSVKLAPLARDSVRALAGWALPRYDTVQLDRVTRRVAMDSAGLPMLVIELLSAISLGLSLDGAASAWPAPLRTLHQTLPGDLPDAIVGAARVGFQRLSADARLTLSAVAVLGGRVARDRLRRATALGDEALTAALQELEWQRWLAAEPRGYAFVARVMADVVAADLTSKTLRQQFLASAPNS
ncbi:MAG TPA: AAA family ATPase, partial [Gemmatimonadales bacterium]